MCFTQTELVLQTKNQSEPAKNQFSVALVYIGWTLPQNETFRSLPIMHQRERPSLRSKITQAASSGVRGVKTI